MGIGYVNPILFTCVLSRADYNIGGLMKYYIHGPVKTTGPYTEEELERVKKAFPLKGDMEVIDEDAYNLLKTLGNLN